jgi:hypothetical protein
MSAKVMHKNETLARLLRGLDLGSSVAESDTVLEAARVETSAFTDLLHDRVDLIPGTKGSGKSALFRMFVDFLPDHLLRNRKVVVAHGVQAPGDPVFHAFSAHFEKLSEGEFVSFWCIYLVSLAHEQFLKGPRYQDLLKNASYEISKFREACERANIPEIKAEKSLRDILAWSLHVLSLWRPKLSYKVPLDGGEFEMDLFGSKIEAPAKTETDEDALPKYVNDIKEGLESVLARSDLSYGLWWTASTKYFCVDQV